MFPFLVQRPTYLGHSRATFESGCNIAVWHCDIGSSPIPSEVTSHSLDKYAKVMLGIPRPWLDKNPLNSNDTTLDSNDSWLDSNDDLCECSHLLWTVHWHRFRSRWNPITNHTKSWALQSLTSPDSTPTSEVSIDCSSEMDSKTCQVYGTVGGCRTVCPNHGSYMEVYSGNLKILRHFGYPI